MVQASKKKKAVRVRGKIIVDTEVEWEDPPQLQRNPDRYQYEVGAWVDISLVLAQLQWNPGRWGKVYTGGATAIVARAKKYREAGCEVTARRVPPRGKQRTLYARWLG